MIFLWWIFIQIIAESFPISSSGHVQLLQQYFKMSFENAENFNFLLHGPAIIILVIYFFSTWWNLIFLQKLDPCFRKDEDKEKLIFKKKFLQELNPSLKWGMTCFKKLFSPACFIMIADIITFFFWKLQLAKLPWIQNYFLPIGFFITILCLYFSRYQKTDKNFSWSKYDAFVLGVAQGLCLFPGISRFAGTYAAGIWLGYNRKNAVSISFLIQFPLLCAAFLKGMFSMHDQSLMMPNFVQNWILFTVLIASMISYSLFCWVIKLIEQNRLWYFAFYMIIPMSLSLLMLRDVMV